MNIVFWLGIFVTAFLIWLSLAPLFRKLGEVLIDVKDQTKEEIVNEEDSETK